MISLKLELQKVVHTLLIHSLVLKALMENMLNIHIVLVYFLQKMDALTSTTRGYL